MPILRHVTRPGHTTLIASPPAPTPRAAYVIVDAENVDRTLGGIYGRRPRSAERPRWERLPDFIRKHFAPDVKAYMVLAARNTPQFAGFVGILPDLDFEPVVVNPQPGVPVVDRAIQAMLRCIPPHADLILITHDADFIEALEPLVAADRRVAIIGFAGQVSHVYREHGEIEIYDIVLDVAAFDVPPPRETKAAVDLDDFDPGEFM